MSTAETVLLIAELLDVTFGHFIPDCGGDFIPELAPTICKGCKFYNQCERMTKAQSINAELQRSLTVKEPASMSQTDRDSAGMEG